MPVWHEAGADLGAWQPRSCWAGLVLRGVWRGGGGLGEAGGISQRRLCQGWERGLRHQTATEEGECDSKRSRACPCCPLPPHPAWKGAKVSWGPGTALERRRSPGGQEPVPASKTNSRDQGRGCHLAGTRK